MPSIFMENLILEDESKEELKTYVINFENEIKKRVYIEQMKNLCDELIIYLIEYFKDNPK